MDKLLDCSAKLPPLDRARLSHAYIISAPASESEELAVQLAALMLCRSGGDRPCGVCSDCRKAAAGTHPDIFRIERLPDDKGRPRRDITVGQIRAAAADAVVLPNEAACKVYIFPEANRMNEQAQNALLKLLEEPPKHVRFILCAENAGALLDTIRSRCIELSVRSAAQCSEPERIARYLEFAGRGDALELLRFCRSMEELTPAELTEFVRETMSAIGARLSFRADPGPLSGAQLMGLYELFGRALKYLRVNVGVKQVLSLISVRTLSRNI